MNCFRIRPRRSENGGAILDFVQCCDVVIPDVSCLTLQAQCKHPTVNCWSR